MRYVKIQTNYNITNPHTNTRVGAHDNYNITLIRSYTLNKTYTHTHTHTHTHLASGEHGLEPREERGLMGLLGLSGDIVISESTYSCEVEE